MSSAVATISAFQDYRSAGTPKNVTLIFQQMGQRNQDRESQSRGMSAEVLQEICEELRNGKSDRFGEIVDKYRGYVLTVIHSLVPPHEVEEVAHAAFIKVFRALPKYREDGKFLGWIKRIAVRTAYDFWREERRRREIPWSPEDLLALFQEEESEDELSPLVEARAVAERALSYLQPEDRMLVVLLYLEEWSVAEVAKALGWSRMNTKVRAHRARKFLRGKLERM